MTSFLVMQLIDGAFPSGGFAHSSGLEAAVRIGGLSEAEAFLDQSLRQAGRASLPFVRAACVAPAELAALDARVHATLLSHVASRASRAQGRALASAGTRIFALSLEAPWFHLAPTFGAVFGMLGVSPAETEAAFLHAAGRGILSAAVRLGILGPLEAQRIQASRAALMDQILASCTHLAIDDAAQTAPLVELYGALHDELDGRLFQS